MRRNPIAQNQDLPATARTDSPEQNDLSQDNVTHDIGSNTKWNLGKEGTLRMLKKINQKAGFET